MTKPWKKVVGKTNEDENLLVLIEQSFQSLAVIPAENVPLVSFLSPLLYTECFEKHKIINHDNIVFPVGFGFGIGENDEDQVPGQEFGILNTLRRLELNLQTLQKNGMDRTKKIDELRMELLKLNRSFEGFGYEIKNNFATLGRKIDNNKLETRRHFVSLDDKFQDFKLETRTDFGSLRNFISTTGLILCTCVGFALGFCLMLAIRWLK